MDEGLGSLDPAEDWVRVNRDEYMEFRMAMDFYDEYRHDIIEALSWVKSLKYYIKELPSRDAITIKNAHFDTDLVTNAVVTVDGSKASGWQWPIRVTSPGHKNYPESKCIGCDGHNQNGHLLCEICREVLTLWGKSGVRDYDLTQTRIRLLIELANDERMIGLLEMLGTDSIAKYMEEAIGAIARDAHDDADGEDRGGAEPGAGA